MFGKDTNFMNLIAIAIFLVLIVSACIPKVDLAEGREFRGVSQVSKGSPALIKWHFPNAEEVYVDYVNKPYSALDSIVVYPIKTTEYNIKAVSGRDSSIFVWKVFVIEDTSELFPSEQSLTGLPISYGISDYFAGILPADLNANPSNLKIMKSRISKDNPNILKVNALIMDEYGNYLENRFSDTNSLLTYSSACQAERIKANSRSFKENSSTEQNINYTFLIDNSLFAIDYSSVIDNIRKLKLLFDENDKISLSLFNQKYIQTVAPNFRDSFFQQLSEIEDFPTPSGLSGIFKSSYESIKNMQKESQSDDNVLILIAYGTDNGSILYTAKDLFDYAKRTHSSIYTIGVGNAVDSYLLRYIAEATGGRFYSISDEKPTEIFLALREIVFAQTANYEFELWLSEDQLTKCDNTDIALDFVRGENTTTSGFIYYIQAPQLYPAYQAIALFDTKNADVKLEYDDLLLELAVTLNNNPSHKIELIGHSGIEGNTTFNNDIALERAQKIRRELIKYNVAPEQIRVRGEGNSKPLYFLNQYTWQDYLNRRVEIRWLDPSLLPYEIITGLYSNETEALQKVEEWENRGFKSYYERYLVNNFPHYRVKLWGYATEEAAQQEITRLISIYGKSFSLQ